MNCTDLDDKNNGMSILMYERSYILRNARYIVFKYIITSVLMLSILRQVLVIVGNKNISLFMSSSLFIWKVPLEAVIWIYDTFDNGFRIDNDFTQFEEQLFVI